MELKLFSNTNIKSIVKHHLLLKLNKYTAVTANEHVYLKGKGLSKLYLSFT